MQTTGTIDKMERALWRARIAMSKAGAAGDTANPLREAWEDCQRALDALYLERARAQPTGS